MKTAMILVIASGLLCQNLIGSEHPKATYDPLQTLKKASIFCIGGFGIAATTSPGEKALSDVIRGANAKTVLIRLLDEATPEGQMYALVGLNTLDPAEFNSRLASYTNLSIQVRTARGCIIDNQPIAHVVKAIQAGQYNLPAR